jgi:RND family efflux transporter MFP subunit
VSAVWRRRIRTLLGAGIVAGTGAALGAGCGERIGPDPPGGTGAAPPAAGGIASVERVEGPAVEWASGAVASARRTAVAARVLARIEEVRVRAASEVSEGEVLVVLDARDLQARVQKVQEALRGGRARQELAAREEERTAKLIREGVATEQRLDQVTSELRMANAEVDRLEQSLEEARTALSHTTIRAPVPGRVIDRLAEPGDTAVPGEPLLRIYDPSVLRVEVPVRESLAITLREGAAIRVEVPSLGRSFDGAIDEIVPFAEPGARTLLVKVRVPSDPRLLAGMYARAAIQAGERARLRIPRAAVEQVGQLEFVTVLDAEGRGQRRLVTTGATEGAGGVEVLSGLREGERVLIP